MNTYEQLELLIGKGERAHDLDLRGASLAEASLSGLSADRLDFREADLRRAQLSGVRLGNCRFEAAKFEAANWSRATLRMCVMDTAQGAVSRFEEACIEDGSARGADLRGASFQRSKLSETSFDRAVLREAVFDGAQGDGIVFRGADLGAASLVGVRFCDADFRGADLRKANLKDGVFRHADFRGALLEGVDFSGTDCSGAYFDSEEDVYAAPTAAAEPSLQELQTLLTNLVQQTQQGTTPKSPLLDELMKRAGVGQGAAQTGQAALLGRILDTVHDLEAHAGAPDVLVQRCQAILRDVLPQLDDTLGDADWQALSKILSGLPADTSNRHADRD